MLEARPRQDIRVTMPMSAGTYLYMTVFNFDPTYRQSSITYTISVNTFMTATCTPCANNEPLVNSQCFCQNCLDDTFGKICSRESQVLQSNVTNQHIQAYSFRYYEISYDGKVIISLSVQGGTAEGYIQLKRFDEEVASFYNVAKSDTDQGRFLLINNVSQVVVDTSQRNALITIVPTTNNDVYANVIWYPQSSVSILIILMSVLGGILFIVIVIVTICIIRRNLPQFNRIEQRGQRQILDNKLKNEEIQRHFPACVYQDIFALKEPLENCSIVGQISINYIHNETMKQKTEVDCVICLQMINYTDNIRIGYCRHMFHGQCLTSWFQKQTNCPYCRKQYGRKETLADYSLLVSENNGKKLEGVELCRAIYARKVVQRQEPESLPKN